jgi:ribosomal protein L7/L12
MDDEVQITSRLAALERRVDAIMRHLGIAEPTISTTASSRVQELARQGDKIQAIKAYREETGVGLAEAKAVVDRLF